MSKETDLIATISQAQSVHVLVMICATGEMPLHVEGRILVQSVLYLVPHLPWVAARLQSRDSTPVLYLSLLRPLCEPQPTIGLYNVTNVLWAICCGTRTCSGDPEADWRLANGEDTMTSGAVRCQTSLLIMHLDTCRPLEPVCHRLCGV